MRIKGFIATAVVGAAFLLVGSTEALADLDLIHNSEEGYFSNGGTDITPLTNCQVGCFEGEVGDATGTFLWKIIQQGFWDVDGGDTGVANSTQITYTVGNVAYDDPIMSFHTPAFMEPVILLTDPFLDTDNDGHPDWTATWAGGFIWWSTDLVAAGIIKGEDLNKFKAIWDDIFMIGFDGPVTVDFGGDPLVEFSSEDWVVSTIPLPGAWLLGALGLGMVGWVKRRFA